ncbi:DUF4437 domain-containing protein [Pseudomonas sp. NPDC090202]|uniref:DUF4437 domain-containing protein n=1 Tax=unclassified Pseudomonas TaxID=196821 RepID=UPI00381EAAEA
MTARKYALVSFLAAAVMAPAAFAATDATEGTSVVVPVTQMHFYQNKEGLTIANGWGDPAAGAHSNFIKMEGNTASPLHTHTYSYYGVVINGVVANEPTTTSPDHPLAPGSYWYQKGGEPHVTKCISQTECLFFVTSKGPFDFAKTK